MSEVTLYPDACETKADRVLMRQLNPMLKKGFTVAEDGSERVLDFTKDIFGGIHHPVCNPGANGRFL